jgi:hypothetical protein
MPTKQNNPIKKTYKRSNIPITDLDFANVAQLVATKWNDNLWLSLLHSSPNAFEAKVNDFRTALSAKIQTKSSRPQTTDALRKLDALIDQAIGYVKIYIIEKYKKQNAKSYFDAFGIENTGRLPIGKNKRLAALQLTLEGIATNGFETKVYGTAFWTDIKSQYETLLIKASSIDSATSTKVGEKNALKKELKIVVNAIIYAIKANYPNNFKEELRNWGFQKEKY